MTGRPADTRTEAQKIALRLLLSGLRAEYPKALIMGHNVFEPMKERPCFDARAGYCGV